MTKATWVIDISHTYKLQALPSNSASLMAYGIWNSWRNISDEFNTNDSKQNG